LIVTPDSSPAVVWVSRPAHCFWRRGRRQYSRSGQAAEKLRKRLCNNGTASAGPHKSIKFVGASAPAALAFTKIFRPNEFFRSLWRPALR
jgi:hypothetical protein